MFKHYCKINTEHFLFAVTITLPVAKPLRMCNLSRMRVGTSYRHTAVLVFAQI